ncbi:MAG: dihydrofolate reductase family protein [Candidatus Phaeomarinobacter sp.]
MAKVRYDIAASADGFVATADGGVAWRKDDSRGDIWAVGGSASTAPLIAANLVDRFELSIMPDLLGSGIRLLPEGTQPAKLKLLSHKAYADGVLSLVYVTDA